MWRIYSIGDRDEPYGMQVDVDMDGIGPAGSNRAPHFWVEPAERVRSQLPDHSRLLSLTPPQKVSLQSKPGFVDHLRLLII